MRRKYHYKSVLTAAVVFSLAAMSPCATAVTAAANSGIAAPGQQGPDAPVLERFRSYAGPRTPEGLAALLSNRATGIVRQQPLIALSDGRTAVMVAIKVAASDNSAPGFAFTGAKLVTLQRKQNDEWLLKAIPEKGVWQASLLVANSTGTVEYPLVVAPALPAETDLSDQGFAAFLGSEQTNTNGPRQDLNQDGRYDYIDDYIFTANYLVKQSTTGTSREARRQRALKRTLSAPNSIPPPAPPKQAYDGVFYGDP